MLAGRLDKLRRLIQHIKDTGVEPGTATELGRYLRDRRTKRVGLLAAELVLANESGFINLFDPSGNVEASRSMACSVSHYIDSGMSFKDICAKDPKAGKWLRNKKDGLENPKSRTKVYAGELKLLISLGLVDDGAVVVYASAE